MHALVVFTSIFLAPAAVSYAEPIQPRDELSSIVQSLTSVVGSAYTHGTAAAASYYTDGLSAASVGIQEGLSDASTWLTAHSQTSGIFATATTIGGAAESIVISVGGPAITLAASGGGVVTSFAGSQFTVTTSPTSTSNAAMSAHSVSLTAPPMLTALITVVGGTLLGAWLTY